MQISRATIEGFNVKRDDRGPFVDIKLRARPSSGELQELYGLLLEEGLTLEVQIDSKQEVLAG